MGFWETLALRLRRANLDDHRSNLEGSGFGSQIFVPDYYNDGHPGPVGYGDLVKSMGEQHGLKHAKYQSLGGWVPHQDGRALHENVQFEPMTVHGLYGADPTSHNNLREHFLPDIQKTYSQDATLGTMDASQGDIPEHHGAIKPFSLQSLQAHLPIKLDPQDQNNAAYRFMLARLGELNGGFTHYQTPDGNQIQLHTGNPRTLDLSKRLINEYLAQNHGAIGKFDVTPTQAFLHRPFQALNKPKTAMMDSKGSHVLAPVRNIIHAIRDAAQLGDMNAYEFLKELGLDE